MVHNEKSLSQAQKKYHCMLLIQFQVSLHKGTMQIHKILRLKNLHDIQIYMNKATLVP